MRKVIPDGGGALFWSSVVVNKNNPQFIKIAYMGFYSSDLVSKYLTSSIFLCSKPQNFINIGKASLVSITERERERERESPVRMNCE